jgi:hypothetical protein
MRVQNDVRVTIRVDEETIPFPVSVKHSDFGAGYTPSEITDAFETAVRGEIAEQRSNGLPVARYDAEDKRAYLESADGTREM